MARLSVESGAVARAAKAAAKEREEVLVEVDMWKLEVRRLRTLLDRQVERLGWGGVGTGWDGWLPAVLCWGVPGQGLKETREG